VVLFDAIAVAGPRGFCPSVSCTRWRACCSCIRVLAALRRRAGIAVGRCCGHRDGCGPWPWRSPSWCGFDTVDTQGRPAGQETSSTPLGMPLATDTYIACLLRGRGRCVRRHMAWSALVSRLNSTRSRAISKRDRASVSAKRGLPPETGKTWVTIQSKRRGYA